MSESESESERDRDLLAWGEQLSGAMTSADEPLCVAQCFARPVKHRPRFTMQVWIDLETIRSPLLSGRQFESIEQISASFSCFDLALENGLTGEEAALVEEVLRAVIAEAFAMSLSMSPPLLPGEQPRIEGPDGFGQWLPIFACLVAEMGLTPFEARSSDVGQTLALVAAHRRNQGWRVTGKPYAAREVISNQSETVISPDSAAESSLITPPAPITDHPGKEVR